MIRVERAAEEPNALRKAREKHLPEARKVAAKRRLKSKDFKGYKVAHDSLWKSQRNKCCYCELREQSKRNDVEHFRPKTRANRTPAVADDHGYWWLAWTWENLLFSCRNCNQAPAKVDKFPLAVGSEVLEAEEKPPGLEEPLLIDPATESGIDHIQFVFKKHGPRKRWVPIPRKGSERGKWTIEVCKLDRPDLLDLYESHVDNFIKKEIDKINQAIAADDAAQVKIAWKMAIGIYTNPWQAFVGLAYDALDHFVPAETRDRFGLELNVPA